MTTEQRNRLSQGLFFGLLFGCFGYLMKGCAGKFDAVKNGGKFGMIMGALMVAWGIWRGFAKPK